MSTSSQTTLIRRKNDILLKSAFEEAFPDLLRFFFKDSVSIFEIERGFEFMDKELNDLFPELEKKGGGRLADMLVKTYLKDGREEWMLIHLEIQDQNDKHFAKRMFQYFYRIYDRYSVPITAFAIFTGNSVPDKSIYFRHEFLGTTISYQYNCYHILDHTPEQLILTENPFALIVLAAQKALLINKIPEEELGQHRLLIARALIKSGKYGIEKIRRFMFFLKTFVYIADAKINFNFDKEIDSLTNNQTAMGIIEAINMLTKEEGIKEGIAKKSYEVVDKLLLAGKFSITEVANFANVTESFVRKVQKEIQN